MRDIIIGTAGHVDHGKTTLIRALTGIDTDRLKEEKERGISIDLGFAHFTLPSGRRAGVIDVPGHERFIRNMLAGAGSMDLVLLVVAADEGIMPQTREHLEILELLGVTQGVIVLTKADLVEEDWLVMVEEELKQSFRNTFLDKAPICRVSAATGQGIGNLVATIDRLTDQVAAKPLHLPFRLPIDRVFSIPGFGTVVTGTMLSGQLAEGDRVEIQPLGREARVRGIQVYGKKVKMAQAGQRTAVNLAGIEMAELVRGDVLAQPGYLEPSSVLDGRFFLLPDSPCDVLVTGARIRLYIGTREVMGRIYLLDRAELRPGDNALAQFRLEEEVAAAFGDRFVVRSYSPMHTIGGGKIIDPNARRHRRNQQKVLQSLAVKELGNPELSISQILIEAGGPVPLSQIAGHCSNLTITQVRDFLQDLVTKGQVITLPAGDGDLYLHANVAGHLETKLREMLTAFHRQFPLREGMSREELRGKMLAKFPPKQAQALFDYWQEQGIIVAGHFVRLTEHQVTFTGQHAKLRDDIEGAFRAQLFTPPALEELVKTLGGKGTAATAVAESLLAKGILVKVAEGIVFHREAVAMAQHKLQDYFATHSKLLLADFRDLLGTSRKFALPLLEYFDNKKITRRQGDERVPGEALRGEMS